MQLTPTDYGSVSYEALSQNVSLGNLPPVEMEIFVMHSFYTSVKVYVAQLLSHRKLVFYVGLETKDKEVILP